MQPYINELKLFTDRTEAVFVLDLGQSALEDVKFLSS